MSRSVSTSSSSEQVFRPADLSYFIEKFPDLAGKAIIGKGCFSYVFEGNHPDTVLKLTCDMVYRDFILSKGSKVGLPKLFKNCGTIESTEFGSVSLLEIGRLTPLDKWDHERMVLERDAVSSAIEFKVAMSEIDTGMMPCQVAHAMALRDIRRTSMFSPAVGSALTAISQFMEETEHDVLLDLRNPANYMTDGKSLIITDPLIMVA